MTASHALPPLLLSLSILLLLLAGCGSNPESNGAASPGLGDGLLQSVAIDDPAGDQDGDVDHYGRLEGIDLVRVDFEEYASRLRVVLEFVGSPAMNGFEYYCSLEQPGNDTSPRIVASFYVRDGKPSNSSGVGFRIEDHSLIFEVAYDVLAKTTWRPNFLLQCSAETVSSGSYLLVDHTEEATLTWALVRRLGDLSSVVGVGPYGVETRVASDPCCDVARSYPGGPTEKVDFAPGDLRDFWIWQDANGLWLQANTTGNPLDSAGLRFEYPAKASGDEWRENHGVYYDYGNGRAEKRPGGTTVQAEARDNHAIRLFVPWDLLEDREGADYLSLSVFLFSNDGRYAYADGLGSVVYRLK